jgi:hypothetical protein
LFSVEVFIWQVSGTPYIFSNFMADFLKILRLESQLRDRNTFIVSPAPWVKAEESALGPATPFLTHEAQ